MTLVNNVAPIGKIIFEIGCIDLNITHSTPQLLPLYNISIEQLVFLIYKNKIIQSRLGQGINDECTIVSF